MSEVRSIIAKGTGIVVVPFALVQGVREIEARQAGLVLIVGGDGGVDPDDVAEIVAANRTGPAPPDAEA